MQDLKLCDLGEKCIVNDLIVSRFPEISQPYGSPDDCAIAAFGKRETLVHTTDPCPTPVVYDLFESDPFHFGWMTVTINGSDIAAMGATPVHMLLMIEAPPTYAVFDFNRLIDGVEAASQTFGIPIAGGNLRDGPVLRVEGAMLGSIEKGSPLTRSSLLPGHSVWAIGNSGHFWTSILLAQSEGYKTACLRKEVQQALCRPAPASSFAIDFQKSNIGSAAMDASDGIMSGLETLAAASSVSIEVNLSKIHVDPWVATHAPNLFCDSLVPTLAWGDWQLMVGVCPGHEDDVIAMAKKHRLHAFCCGHVLDQSKNLVSYHRNGRKVSPPYLKSEKFSTDHSNWTYTDWANHIRNSSFDTR